MARQDKIKFTGALDPLLRMQAAMGLVPVIDAPRDQMLLLWLEAVAFPTEAESVSLGVSISATLDRLTWRVINQPDVLIARVADLMQANELPEDEIALLIWGVAALQPARFGAWMSAREEAQDAGWYMVGSIPLAKVRPHVGNSPAARQTFAWLNSWHIEHCTRFGRSVGAGNPYTELILPLSGAGMKSPLEAILDLFTTLQLPEPPDLALASLLEAAPPEIALSVWFSPDDLVKIGVQLPNPSPLLLLRLIRAVGVEAVEPLAAFEGALGAESAALIELQLLASGFEIELHYALQGVPY